MEVQLIEAPTAWVKPDDEEFNKERTAFFEGLKEVSNDDIEADEAPF